METKTLSLLSLAIILMAALAVGYLISRPAGLVPEKSVPIFMGEEVVVHKEVTAPVRPMKAETSPAPQPKVAMPLPMVPPVATFRLLPEYPAKVLGAGIEGLVLVQAYVGMNGAVERVEVKTSSGNLELDQSAARAVAQWKFAPAIQGGAALASWFEVPVRFSIK